LGLRMQAGPGQGTYGALSAWLQAQAQVKLLKRLSPSVFWPRPKVESAVVRLIPDPEARATIRDREFFHDFVRRVFLQRRKLLRGVVAGMYRKELDKPQIDQLLEDLALTPQTRAEELAPPRLVELANRLHQTILAQNRPQDPPITPISQDVSKGGVAAGSGQEEQVET
jgi:16S rRNA (adenine1518-N6/adenine1519-N6)-dimethyltransferase